MFNTEDLQSAWLLSLAYRALIFMIRYGLRYDPLSVENICRNDIISYLGFALFSMSRASSSQRYLASLMYDIQQKSAETIITVLSTLFPSKIVCGFLNYHFENCSTITAITPSPYVFISCFHPHRSQ